MSVTIKYLKHIDINKEKWDKCILNSTNSLIFAYSFYLDIMAPNWDGIVINDYEFVLPLPVKKKFGIKYFYIPPFTSQLGLFGKSPTLTIDSLLPILKSNVHYGDLFFNYANIITPNLIKLRTNFILDLKNGYQKLYSNYSADLKRILRKQVKNKLLYSKENNIEYAVKLYKQYYAERTPHLSKNDYKKFKNVCNFLYLKSNCFTRSLCTDDGTILCAMICFFDGKKIYTIINPSTTLGRKKEAAVFLFDELIKEFSGSDKILDFVGSDLPGVKFFLNKYCPTNQPVFFYHYNNLPYPIRFFKK